MKRPEELRKGKEEFISQEVEEWSDKYKALFEDAVEKQTDDIIHFYENDKVLVDKEKKESIFEEQKKTFNRYPQLANEISEKVNETIDSWLKEYSWRLNTDKSGTLYWLEPIDVPETAEETTTK